MPHPKLCRIPCRSIQHNLSRSLNMIHLRYSILQDSSLADTKSRYSCLRCCPNNHCELGQTDNFHRLSTPLIPTLFYICLGCSLSSFPPSCRCTLDDMFQASSLHRSNTARIPTMTCTCLTCSLSRFPPSLRRTRFGMSQTNNLGMSSKSYCTIRLHSVHICSTDRTCMLGHRSSLCICRRHTFCKTRHHVRRWILFLCCTCNR